MVAIGYLVDLAAVEVERHIGALDIHQSLHLIGVLVLLQIVYRLGITVDIVAVDLAVAEVCDHLLALDLIVTHRIDLRRHDRTVDKFGADDHLVGRIDIHVVRRNLIGLVPQDRIDIKVNDRVGIHRNQRVAYHLRVGAIHLDIAIGLYLAVNAVGRDRIGYRTLHVERIGRERIERHRVPRERIGHLPRTQRIRRKRVGRKRVRRQSIRRILLAGIFDALARSLSLGLVDAQAAATLLFEFYPGGLGLVLAPLLGHFGQTARDDSIVLDLGDRIAAQLRGSLVALGLLLDHPPARLLIGNPHSI